MKKKNITQKSKPRYKENLNQQSTLITAHMCGNLCVSLGTSVVHNTAQNNSDNLPCYPPDSGIASFWCEKAQNYMKMMSHR